MSEAWIRTFSGKMFDLLDPQPEMIYIEDIAHAGSQMNRFTGHCRFPYPVTQHERLGSYLVPEEHALQFLLHDASESYLGDMNRPLKHFTDAGIAYQVVEAKIQALIYDVFGLSAIEAPIVKEIDNRMLCAEKRQLMPTPDFIRDVRRFDFRWSKDTKAANVEIVETSFVDNKRMFLERFYQLK